MELYCFYRVNDDALLSISDTDTYVIVINPKDFIFKIYLLPVFIRRWKIEAHTGLFFRKVACTGYDAHWFIEWMYFM
jgi:hypothetical protein